MGERATVHLALRWGDAVVRTASLSPPRSFTLGEGGDWELPAEAVGAARASLLVRDGRRLFLSLPPSATAWVADASGSPFRPAPSHALGLGARGQVALGPFTIDVEVVAAPAVLRRRIHFALGAFGHQALSLAFHVGLLAMLALFVPRVATGEDDAEDQAERVAYLRRVLGGRGALEREAVTVGLDEDYAAREGGDGPANGMAPGGDRAAALGAPARWTTRRLPPASRPAATQPDARDEAAALAAMFALAPVTNGSGGALPGAAWGRSSSAGDANEASASSWGARGGGLAAGDLALSGVGAGSDGPEEMIGLSGFGTSRDTAFGFGSSRGLGGMMGRGASHFRAPRLCGCDGVLVNGRLPPETIQRVVRESFGRFRACYEPALVQSPSLQGRVTTRFLVARDGLVSFAVDAGSDLPDARVVSCVVRAFTSVAFPPPAGGTVEVTYPIVFSPE